MMTDSDEESIRERSSQSSDNNSIVGYEDDLSQEDSDILMQTDEVDLDAEGADEGFRVVQEKRVLQKLKQEETLVPVPRELRCTNDCISKYEYAKVIGMRAMQIASNSPLYLEDPFEDLKGLSAIQLAEKEFAAKRLPFIVRRILPNATYEDWPVNELNNKNI